MDDISVQLFALLRRYARAGMAVGNNRELVTSSFKVWREGGREVAQGIFHFLSYLSSSILPTSFLPPPSLPSLLPQAMTVIVRDFKKHEIKKDELQVLLSFVEEDIHDYQRQSTAFPLLKVRVGGRVGGNWWSRKGVASHGIFLCAVGYSKSEAVGG